LNINREERSKRTKRGLPHDQEQGKEIKIKIKARSKKKREAVLE